MWPSLVDVVNAVQGRLSLAAVGLWPVTGSGIFDERVRCFECGGVTVFPRHRWIARPTYRPCAHCGVFI